MAAYMRDGMTARAYGIMVLTVRDGMIGEITGFADPSLFPLFGPDAAERALDEPHVRPMDFTGRPMKGMVYVEPAGLAGPALRRWVGAAADYARSLPPKLATPPGKNR